MLDQFAAAEVEAVATGVVAQVGAYRFAFLASHRDRDHLTAPTVSSPVLVWCEIEFDVTSGTLAALAFADEERRALYRALRAISGIGRASAFAVLDAGEVIDTLRAVSGADKEYFKAVPGLGPKKVAAVIETLSKRYGGRLPQPLPTAVALLVEARDALVQEGRSLGAAEEALLRALASFDPQPVRSSEEWLALVDRDRGPRG